MSLLSLGLFVLMLGDPMPDRSHISSGSAVLEA